MPRALEGIQIAPLVHHRGWGRGRSRRERAAAGREGARDAAAKRSEPREAATADHKARSLMVSAHENTVQARCWRHPSPFYHLCTQNDRRAKPIYYKGADDNAMLIKPYTVLYVLYPDHSNVRHCQCHRMPALALALPHKAVLYFKAV